MLINERGGISSTWFRVSSARSDKSIRKFRFPPEPRLIKNGRLEIPAKLAAIRGSENSEIKRTNYQIACTNFQMKMNRSPDEIIRSINQFLPPFLTVDLIVPTAIRVSKINKSPNRDKKITPTSPPPIPNTFPRNATTRLD